MQIELYTPHAKQVEVHKTLNDDETFVICVNAGRQSGKTMMCENQALYWGLKNNKRIIYWVSPTAGQASKVYKKIINNIIDAPFLKSYKGSQGDTEIVFKNDSVIKFRSAAQGDSLRGETVDYMIVDEAAFIKEEIFSEILLPMLNVNGIGFQKKCLIVSTPKGKNWFFKMFNKGRDKLNKDIKSYKYTSYDSPYTSLKTIEIAKNNMPSVLFRQEYLAEFIDDTSIFENIEELATIEMLKEPQKDDEYYIGVDVALKNDYNVITIFNQKDEMVCYDRVNNITAPQLKERMVQIFNKWKPKKIYIEANNQGLPIIQDLKEIYKIKNIKEFQTTSTSKQLIINNLINAFASKKIKIINDETIKSEFEMFTMFINSNGAVKFSAPSGYNDDIVMATAIAWECLQKNKGGNVEFGFEVLDFY